MGKAILIFVISVTVVGAFYASGDQRAQLDTTKRQASDEFMILARNAALTGLDRTEQLLADDFKSYGKRTGTYNNAQYEYQATRQGQKRVIVRSTGTAQNRDGKTVEFNVRAEYERQPWSRIADEPPLFMQYLLMAGGNLSLRGNARGEVYDPDDGSSTPPNADMHTNALLAVEGSNAQSDGFGTFVVGELPNSSKVEDAFDPNDNPTGGEHAYQVPPVLIPPLNTTMMAISLLPDSVTIGNVVVNGPGNLPPMIGTRDDPFVWHIQGNLTFSSGANVSIPGYTIVLVDGMLNIQSNAQVTTPPTSYEGMDQSTLAFYVAGLTTLAGQTTVWAQIFGNNVNILAEGQSKLYGNLVTNGDVNFGGQARYYYRSASPALTTYFQGGINDRLVRVSYSEWSKTVD